MRDRIVLTWPDGNGHPMRIVDTEIVRYVKYNQVTKNGTKVNERTVTEFTVASARPATEAEVQASREQ